LHSNKERIEQLALGSFHNSLYYPSGMVLLYACIPDWQPFLIS